MRRVLILLLLLHSLPAYAGGIWVLAINNDAKEERHRQNLARAVQALSSRYGMSPQELMTVGAGAPLGMPNLPSTPLGLAEAVLALRARMERPDLMVLYMTGHGTDFEDRYSYWLDGKQYGIELLRNLFTLIPRPRHLLVVVDTCYSGLATPALEGLADRTTAISSTGATKTSCTRFASTFWTQLADPHIPIEQAFGDATEHQREFLISNPDKAPPRFHAGAPLLR